MGSAPIPSPIPIPFLSSNLLVAWANSLHLEQRFIALIVVVVVVLVAAFVDSPATVAVLCCDVFLCLVTLRFCGPYRRLTFVLQNVYLR